MKPNEQVGIHFQSPLSPTFSASFKPFAQGKTAQQLLTEARKEELAKDNELMKRARKSNI